MSITASELLSASPEDYWQDIENAVQGVSRSGRFAFLLNHQAAHLLAWAQISRAASLGEAAPDDFWTRVEAEVAKAGRLVQHASLLSQDAAQLLTLASVSRNAAKADVQGPRP